MILTKMFMVIHGEKEKEKLMADGPGVCFIMHVLTQGPGNSNMKEEKNLYQNSEQKYKLIVD